MMGSAKKPPTGNNTATERDMTESCGYCGEEPQVLRTCTRCRSVRYCNRQCQKSHWTSGHKDECQPVASCNPDDVTISYASPASSKLESKIRKAIDKFVKAKSTRARHDALEELLDIRGDADPAGCDTTLDGLVSSTYAMKHLAMVLEEWSSSPPHSAYAAHRAAAVIMWASGANGQRQAAIARSHGGRTVKALLNILGNVTDLQDIVPWEQCATALSNLTGRALQVMKDDTIVKVMMKDQLGSIAIRKRLEDIVSSAEYDKDGCSAFGTLITNVFIAASSMEETTFASQLLSTNGSDPSLATLDHFADLFSVLCGASEKDNSSADSKINGLMMGYQLHFLLFSMQRVSSWHVAQLFKRVAMHKTLGRTAIFWLMKAMKDPMVSRHPMASVLSNGFLNVWSKVGDASAEFRAIVEVERSRSTESTSQFNGMVAECCAADGCNNDNLGGRQLNRCSGCGVTWYCGKECQVRDWPKHKATCKKFQKSRKGSL